MRETDKVIGVRETVKMLKKGRVDHVILAEDTDEEILQTLLGLCREHSIPVELFRSRSLLGRVSGIERPATVVAFLKA